MSDQANIRDIQVLGDLKAGFARFSEDVAQIVSSIQREFEEIQERFEERQNYWQRQVDATMDAVHEARRALRECESQPDDEDGTSPDCGYEGDAVAGAERTLATYQENLETVKQWRHRIEGTISDFQNDLHRLSNLASSRACSAQAFLVKKIDVLNRYVSGTSSNMGTTGLHIQNEAVRISPDDGVAFETTRMRDLIRNAQYVSCEEWGGGVNQSFKLRNGISVLFKPSDGEDQREFLPGVRPGTLYLREKAASVVDQMLGLGLVPPTEIITYNGRVGSAQLFNEGFENARRLADKGTITIPCFEKLTGRQRQDWQLLDELLGNVDRHSSNWMLRRRTNDEFDLALIDNGLCLSESGVTQLKARPASNQKVDSVNRFRLERLLATESEWHPKLLSLVGDAAIKHMTGRAHMLLKRGYYE